MSFKCKNVVRILWLQKSSIETEADLVRALPGEFANDSEAHESLKESGDYIFVTVHKVTIVPETKPDDHGTQE